MRRTGLLVPLLLLGLASSAAAGTADQVGATFTLMLPEVVGAFRPAEGMVAQVDGDRLFIEGVDEYRTPEGHRVATPYAGVLDFRGDLICGWRDYVDLSVGAQHKAGEPLSKQVLELLDRPIAP